MHWKEWAMVIILLANLGLVWLATTNHPAIWPTRNTLQYQLFKNRWEQTGPPEMGEPGTLSGTVTERDGTPIEDAQVLVSSWDGATQSTRTDEEGFYSMEVPAGDYQPVAGAPGYQDTIVGSRWGGVQIVTEVETVADVEMRPLQPRDVPPAENLVVEAPVSVTCDRPIESRAARQRVTFESNGGMNQTTFLYLPEATGADQQLDTLLVVYPGPPEQWECASLPLAASGYAVLATGPAYNFFPEQDVDELEQLIDLLREGALEPARGDDLAVLGGSYSGILVQRLLLRDLPIDAAVLLGPPSDLFALRWKFEHEDYVPPYDLDRVLIAMGFPDREPIRYWRYSGAYHVHPAMPPVALFHSYDDDIIPYEQSEKLAKALDEMDVEHELHLFHGATHYLLAREADARRIQQSTLDFLGRHLD